MNSLHTTKSLFKLIIAFISSVFPFGVQKSCFSIAPRQVSAVKTNGLFLANKTDNKITFSCKRWKLYSLTVSLMTLEFFCRCTRLEKGKPLVVKNFFYMIYCAMFEFSNHNLFLSVLSWNHRNSVENCNTTPALDHFSIFVFDDLL